MKILNRQNLEDLVYGATLFGGGGGGSAEEGFTLIDIMEEVGEIEIPLISLDEMEETEEGKEVVSTMVAALGSPTATKGKTFVDEAEISVKGMMEEAESHGKLLKYIYSGEQGGGNTLLPVYTAHKLKMPLLDLDGNGRAVPAMDTGLQPVYRVPTSPVILGSGDGDTIIGRTKDPCDGKACEKIARYMCQAYDMGIGFAAWMMNKAQHRNSALDQISWSVEAGEIFRTSDSTNVIDNLRRVFEDRNQFRPLCEAGEITAIEMDVAGGFDTGTTTIRAESGEEFIVVFQNENLAVYTQESKSEGKVLAAVPGIIALIDLEPKDGTHPVPVSNTETRIGQKVALIYMDAAPSWYAVPEGCGCWKEILESAGLEFVV